MAFADLFRRQLPSSPLDGKTVNARIRANIWPLLKAEGFSKFTSRTAWRYGVSTIDILNFQSFNTYHASVMGVTTFSFFVNVSCVLRYVPPTWPIKTKNGELIPAESEGQFRARLLPPRPLQKNGSQSVWAIDSNGTNLESQFNDVALQIPSALAWWERLQSSDEVLRILLHDQQEMQTLWGFGRNPSSIRSYLTGYVARHVGQHDLALEKLLEAVDSHCFQSLFSSIDEAVAR